jgi:FMN phosphatase YigB (HAD superfamily)
MTQLTPPVFLFDGDNTLLDHDTAADSAAGKA